MMKKRSWNYNKPRSMRYLLSISILMISIVFLSKPVQAQYDDLYYDPAEDALPALQADFYQSETAQQLNDQELAAYDDQPYEYNLEEDGYHYSSRIRRFHRPVGSFDYYSPAYVESGYYDNCAPGRSIYMSGAFGYSFFSPFNRPFGFGPGFGFGFSTGWGNPYGFGNPYAWGNPYGWGSPFYNPWAWNPYGVPFNNFGVCPVYYTNNYIYYYNNPRGNYYGPRTPSNTVTTRTGRVASTQRSAGIPQPGLPSSDVQPDSRRSGGVAATPAVPRQPKTNNIGSDNNVDLNPAYTRSPVQQENGIERVPAERNNNNTYTRPGPTDRESGLDRVAANGNERSPKSNLGETGIAESERSPANDRYTRTNDRTRANSLDRTTRSAYDRSTAVERSRATRTSRTFDRSSYTRQRATKQSSYTRYDRPNRRNEFNRSNSNPYLRTRSNSTRSSSPTYINRNRFQNTRSTSPSRYTPSRSTSPTRSYRSSGNSSGSRSSSMRSGSRSSSSRSSGTSRSSSPRRGG